MIQPGLYSQFIPVNHHDQLFYITAVSRLKVAVPTWFDYIRHHPHNNPDRPERSPSPERLARIAAAWRPTPERPAALRPRPHKSQRLYESTEVLWLHMKPVWMLPRPVAAALQEQYARTE